MTVKGMNGQWIGRFTGTDNGTLHVNIDEDEAVYRGTAYLFTGPMLPVAVVYFSTADKKPDFSFRTEAIHAVDPATSGAAPWDQVKNKYPGDVPFANCADVKGSFDEQSLTMSWHTDNGVTGECVLPRSKAGEPSELIAEEWDWSTYKQNAIQLAEKRLFFRGQNKRWRLRTPFHRSGRANLQIFVLKDVMELRRQLSARTKHIFRFENEDDYGAFLNLAQHHGYPTPILDWTYSPFVAAFFAYRGISDKDSLEAPTEAKVRILVFDGRGWAQAFESITLLVHHKLHVKPREFVGIENERMIPQQATSTVTSVDDMETHIRSKETPERKFLTAIDLPVRERVRVMRELSYMGITAGSLFPGLDGACQELAERNFRTFSSDLK